MNFNWETDVILSTDVNWGAFFAPSRYFEVGGKIFRAKLRNYGAGGAVLENFGQIFEKLLLKNAVKVNFGLSKTFFRMPLKKRPKNGF